MPDVETLAQKVREGHRRSIARVISQVENNTDLAQQVLRSLFPHTGNAYSIGVTGAPGTGKSVLVTMLAAHLREHDFRVGIIAVDPSSPFTGGAVLGDRFRMRDISNDPGIFIRSMAARGQLGGLARTTFDVMRVLDAAGFDFVIIETVGAGQNEVEITRVADTTVLVEAPGLGDDIQAIKAGILEIADVIAVNKADRPGVRNTVRALRAMLELGHRKRTVTHHGQLMQQDDGAPTVVDDMWMVPIVQTIATENQGVEELYSAIQQHRDYVVSSGLQAAQTRQRLRDELMHRLQAALLRDLLAQTANTQLDAVLEEVLARKLDPESAVQTLLQNVRKS
jgi:LAO/AO transport system kinase